MNNQQDPNENFSGRVALVTGAGKRYWKGNGSGIGAKGASGACIDVTKDVVEATLKSCGRFQPGKSMSQVVDVRSSDEVNNSVQQLSVSI